MTAPFGARLAREKGFTVKADGGKGFRRVVASPSPQEIVEARAIQACASSPLSTTLMQPGWPRRRSLAVLLPMPFWVIVPAAEPCPARGPKCQIMFCSVCSGL